MVFGALGLDPLGPAPTAEPYYPPPKISMGKWGGIRSPPGLNRQDSTKHDRTALQGQTDRTGHDDRKALQGPTDKTSHQGKTDRTRRQESPPGPDKQDTTTGKPSRARQTRHPTGTRSPPGLARRLRLPLGMIRSQGPSQGPSATASTSATRGQAARMASMATTRGAACPRRVSMDKTRQDKVVKMFLWARQNTHGTPGRDMWTWSTGLGIAAASGHEATPIQCLSQRQSGGLESAAIRRALGQRWAGGHWVRGGPAGIESEAMRWRDLPRTARLGERQPGN